MEAIADSKLQFLLTAKPKPKAFLLVTLSTKEIRLLKTYWISLLVHSSNSSKPA